MPKDEPLIHHAAPKGRPADKIAAGIAALGFVLSCTATLWFFLGFYETDPGFSPASSALLLSLGLGAFAIIPSAIVTRLAWSAWRDGFRPFQGLWVLALAFPWIVLAAISMRSEWMPIGLGIGAIILAIPLTLWAIVSLGLANRNSAAG